MNGTHKGIELNFKVEGQACPSPVGWSIDTAFDSQKFVLKEYSFREDSGHTGTFSLAGLSDRQAKFLILRFLFFSATNRFGQGKVKSLLLNALKFYNGLFIR